MSETPKEMAARLENSYQPTTANEAGEEHFSREAGTPDALPSSIQQSVTRRETVPSKPCTEAGEHCFCVGPEFGQAVNTPRCCWCDASQRRIMQRVPGHGPYRTELVREDT